MPRVNTVKAAAKDYPIWGIKKGDTYYWWKFRLGGKHMSLTYPKPSMLTNSSYLKPAHELIERFAGESAPLPVRPDTRDEAVDVCTDIEGFIEGLRDEAVGVIEELRDMSEESLENMPEGLREGSSGELLKERIDACDEAISTLESICFEGDDIDLDIDYDDGEEVDGVVDDIEAKADEAIDEIRAAIDGIIV